uniref:Cysteine--tRNA ligase n=1 Tax=Anthurium amnicola TaxID=1678845 RepID=A0A1D1YQ01_9ARAE
MSQTSLPSFQDLTKPTVKIPWCKGRGRGKSCSYRKVACGLNLEGYCKNELCEAYDKHRVIINWGYKDFVYMLNEHECFCPLCGKYVTPITCGFTDTYWKYKGIKKLNGKPPEKVFCGWQFADSDGYTTFMNEDMVLWEGLTIEVVEEDPVIASFLKEKPFF